MRKVEGSGSERGKAADSGKMHIMFFGDSYRPYVSGAVTSMDMFAAYLRGLGHRVTIVAPDYPDCSEEDDVVRLPSVPFPGYPRLRLITPVSGQGQNRLRGLAPDVVHTHHPFAVGSVGLDVARAVGCPSVFTCHSFYEDYTRYLPTLSQPLKSVVRKYLLNFCGYCDLVIAPSQYVRDFLAEIGVESQLEVLPTGVEPRARQHPGPARLPARADGAYVMIMVGRLAKEKNLDLALLSLFELVQRDPANRDRYRLLMVGGGPELDRLRGMAVELGVRSLVTFLGEVTREQVFQVLRLADAMLFTSVVETQGLVMLEGMSMGLPVIAADSPTARELVCDGTHGYVVPSDPTEIADAIERMAHNRHVGAAMAQAARQKSAEFHPELLAQRLARLYRELLSRGGRRAAAARKPTLYDELSTYFKIEGWTSNRGG